jgi:hypothetical protein
MQQDNGDYKATISDCNTNFKNHEVFENVLAADVCHVPARTCGGAAMIAMGAGRKKLAKPRARMASPGVILVCCIAAQLTAHRSIRW